MKQLPTTIKKGIFVYEQLERSDNFAVFTQRIADLGTIVSFEVFRINKYPDREIHGTLVEAHEAIPGDNQFGVSAWSIRDKDKALARFRELCSREVAE